MEPTKRTAWTWIGAVQVIAGILAGVGMWAGWALWGVDWLAKKKAAAGVPTLAELGQTGDIFGGVSALFAALAFIGVVATVLMQARSLTLLKVQADEARAAAKTAQDEAALDRQSTLAQIAQADLHAQMQLRAYVNVTAVEGKWGKNNKFWVTVAAKNFGQTPAHDLAFTVALIGVPADKTPNMKALPSDMLSSRSILGPGDMTQATVASFEDFSDLREKELEEGRSLYYSYGEITYRDVFGVPRSTRFRLFHGGPHAADGKFASCSEGNEAT